jgi:hypothetical protein
MNRWRGPATLLVLVALAACARTVRQPAGPTASIPEVARVACDADGTRVLTDQVRPQADGVHVVVDNRLGEDAGFAWDDGGDNAPVGEHELVFTEAPGTAHVGCRRNEDNGGDSRGFVSLQIVDPDSVYRHGIACAPVPSEEDATSSSSNIDYVRGTRGSADDPVAAARIDLDWLRSGDELSIRGYPQAGFEREVEVDRDGHALAFAQYEDDGHGGWLLAGVTTCPGVDLSAS